ncbi:MAG TPA: hypothetical protein VKW06_06635 [Candidatus Angelobacter sp.]|nr:hypothetical protein [Candidatus Angelobacter sp.]
MQRLLLHRLFAISAAALLFSVPLASAQKAGYDLLQTMPGTAVDLRYMHLGVVPLKGLLIEACTGNTDTIMHRTEDVPANGKVPVEVYALFLKSTKPIIFHKQKTDVYVTINNSGKSGLVPQPDTLKQSTGTLTILRNHTFTSILTVEGDLIFVKAGADVKDPANYLAHQPAHPVKLTSAHSTWSPKPFRGYPDCKEYPSGGFYARPRHVGPHPVNPGTASPPARQTPKS